MKEMKSTKPQPQTRPWNKYDTFLTMEVGFLVVWMFIWGWMSIILFNEPVPYMLDRPHLPPMKIGVLSISLVLITAFLMMLHIDKVSKLEG